MSPAGRKRSDPGGYSGNQVLFIDQVGIKADYFGYARIVVRGINISICRDVTSCAPEKLYEATILPFARFILTMAFAVSNGAYSYLPSAVIATLPIPMFPLL